MFSLRTSSSTSSSGTDEDSFGWWIGIESHSPAAESEYSQSVDPSQQQQQPVYLEASASPESSVIVSSPDGFGSELKADLEDAEHIELQLFADEQSERSADRSLVCYTPERLIKCEEYHIRTPSPRFYPSFAQLDTARRRLDDGNERYGAAHLAKLLQSPQHYVNGGGTGLSCRRCCPVRYGGGEVVLHTDSCARNCQNEDQHGSGDSAAQPPSFSDYGTCDTTKSQHSDLSNPDYNKKSRKLEQQQQQPSTVSAAGDDSSGVSSVDGLNGTRADDWSCSELDEEDEGSITQMRRPMLRRLSGELDYEYTTLEYTTFDQSDRTSETCQQRSTGHDKIVLDADRLRSASQEGLARLALVVETDFKLPSVKVGSAETETEIELLRDKVVRLQGNSKNLYEEISSLRRDFAIDECKVNHLSESVNKLRNEVYELRYLDDLLKLLKGELERISNRNWPFVIGHTKHGTEELNLVV